MIDKFKSRYRNFIWLTVVALLLAMSTSLIDRQYSGDRSANLQTKIDNERSRIIQLVGAGHPREIDFSSLSESPIDVLISEGDSAIFWNNHITSLSTAKTGQEDYAILYRNIQNSYQISLGLDLTKRGKLDQYLVRKFNLRYKPTPETDVVAEVTDSVGSTYQIRAERILTTSWMSQLGFVFYFLTWFGIMGLVFYQIFVKNKWPVVSGIALGITFPLFHIIVGRHWFANTFLASVKSKSCAICPDIQTLWVIVLSMVFLVSVIKRTRVLDRLPAKIGNVLQPFVIASLFVGVTYLAKSILLSAPLSDLHGEILQYTAEGITYLVSFVGVMAAVFYMSLVLMGQTIETQQPITKYLSWIAGIALTAPMAMLLDIKIPLWTIYAFVLSYLLILEMYIENREKNIIYTIWWIIILAGFLASITFFYMLESNLNVQENHIDHLYSYEGESNTKLVASIDSILKSSEVFPQLAALPYPSGLDKGDYQDFVLSLINQKTIALTADQMSLETTDQQGLTIFNNHYSTAYNYVQNIARADQLTDHIFYNPFLNQYYLKYIIDNENYNDAPFNLYLKIRLHQELPTEDHEIDNYVIFKGDGVVDSKLSNSIPFSIRTLQNITESTIKDDIAYTVYRPTPDVKIIEFDQIGGLIKPISLFSFLVSAMGILIFILALLNTRFGFLPPELNLQFSRSSSLRTRIQLAIIMLIIFSFVIIGIMTAIYFKSVLETYNNNNQKEDITSIHNDIRNSIEGVDNNQMASSTVQAKISEMSHVHDKNLSFFDEQGQLLTSSFSLPRVSSVPFDIVRNFQQPTLTATQNRISLEDGGYTMEFIPVYYKSQQNPYGYLGISYQPINNSSQSIRDFLSTILNVYVFLFLIAGALAIAIGDSITKPLAILSRKLKEFKLGKGNQILDWHTKDEIGNLINEYNLLTEKLDESVDILARTERDVAWREMAKQVAHEIKNPLTPMKLSIQYLEKAVKANPDNAQELIERISITLIEQINNLNQIANEFSNFATMPKASNEKIIINEIVEAIHDLFRKREDMEIRMTEPIDDLFVFADRNHLVRILNNIVKNAIQAIPTDQQGKIKISLTKEGGKAVVSVKDNGTGIPDHMKDKVFTPNFTTKSSGTGLGLAISANMIESFNGKIYFETQVGEGTTFFVEIPLMRLEDNFPENRNRVTLD